MMKPRHSFAIATLSILLFCAASAEKPASPKPSPTPANKVVELLRASLFCKTKTFKVNTSGLSAQQLEWLKQILNFRYSGEPEGMVASLSGQQKVSVSWMRRIVGEKGFDAWAGKDLVDTIKDFIERRRILEGQKTSLPDEDYVDPQESPDEAYVASGVKLIDQVKSKFSITESNIDDEGCK